MRHFETKGFGANRPRFCIRCVDDTFVVFEENVNGPILSTAKHDSASIIFIKEEEKDSTLTFLDMFIMRKPNGSMETTVYKKPTTTDRIFNFKGNHPTYHLKGCVGTLFHRADAHCSTHQLRK